MERIRIATPADAAGILTIYAPYILNTPCTFESEIPAGKDFERRIATYLQTYPWLVYEENDTIAGYAYAAKHRERIAYQWCVEASVYVHDNYMHRGIASKLYEKLFALLTHQGFKNVYAVITLPNDNSVALHEKFGFKWFANFEDIGYKSGKWNTVGWWLKQLNDSCNAPSTPTKFSELSKDEIARFLPGIER